MEAMFMASCTGPRLEAPSPKKTTATWSVLRSLMESPAPQIRGSPPATTPLAPRIPIEKSAMCMEPPLPLQ